MAKMKTFAVEVEVVSTRTVYVQARREGGAREKVMTREGWAEANRYNDDPVLDSVLYPERDGVRITKVRTV